MNVGRFQLLLYPHRWWFFAWKIDWYRVYAWAIAVGPFEIRCFKRQPFNDAIEAEAGKKEGT